MGGGEGGRERGGGGGEGEGEGEGGDIKLQVRDKEQMREVVTPEYQVQVKEEEGREVVCVTVLLPEVNSVTEINLDSSAVRTKWSINSVMEVIAGYYT